MESQIASRSRWTWPITICGKKYSNFFYSSTFAPDPNDLVFTTLQALESWKVQSRGNDSLLLMTLTAIKLFLIFTSLDHSPSYDSDGKLSYFINTICVLLYHITVLKVKTGLINFIDHTLRLFFRPDQSGMSKVEAAVNTLRYVR